MVSSGATHGQLCPSPWAAALVVTAEVTGKRLKYARRRSRTILEWHGVNR